MGELGLDSLFRLSESQGRTTHELMSLNLIELDVVTGGLRLTDKGREFLDNLEADIFVEQIKEGLGCVR